MRSRRFLQHIQNKKRNPDTVKVTEAVYSNLLTVAILQLLDERGVLSVNDVEHRVEKLQAETRIKPETQ